MADRIATPTASAAPGALDAVPRLRLAVLRLARRLRQHAAVGVTPSQLSVLSTVERHGAMTLGDLADHEAVQPPSVTRMVAALEEAGLLARRASDTDRRAVLVELTPAGTRALAGIRTRRDAWLAARLATLDPDERVRLLAALPVLEKLVEVRG